MMGHGTRRFFRRALLGFLTFAALGLHQGCSKSDSPAGSRNPPAATNSPVTKLLITGSSTMAPLIAAIGKRFEALRADIKTEVQSGGSGRGIADTRTSRAHIGMASRALTDEERDLHGFPIARDAICIIVHKNNPVQKLTDQQIIAIYTGKVSNWKEVGGQPAPIEVFYPRAEYGSYSLFMEHYKLRAADVKSDPAVGDNEERIRVVKANPNATVYISVGDAERAMARGEPIKPLAIGNSAPTVANVRKGLYPISRPLTLVTRDPPAGHVKDFIEYALSSQTTDLIVAHKFVPYLD